MPSAVGHRLDTLQARRVLAGISVGELARRANVSDQTVIQLENGGNCPVEVSQRLMDAIALPVAITSNTQANPTVLTTAANLFKTGDTVVIAGVVGSNADVNGTRVATVVSGTTFSVPVDDSVAGGTGGTATPSLASLGLARMN